MADEIPDLQTSALAQDEQAEEDPKDRRSLWGVLLLISVIIIVILLLLLLPRCSANRDGAQGGSGKTIESVTGYDPVPGLISVWVSTDSSVDSVLAAGGVSSPDVMDTGDGRYVVQVAEGSEQAAVDAIKGVAGVYDAGLVYQQEGASAPEAP